VRAFLDFAAAEIGRRKKTIEGMEWGGVGAERAEPQ
jgi:hypothetical protein